MIETCIPLALKQQVVRTLLADPYKIALYTKQASLGVNDGVYSPKGECDGSGYSAGGFQLTGAKAVIDGEFVCVTFDDAKWPYSSIKAAGAQVYNSRTKVVLATIAFGEEKVSSNGPFVVLMPKATREDAVFSI